ncbi:HlyU family transcriptional regulator [Kushneria phosphatilytica]|uniref:Uncharacterized protein n=1 Tax=Kushneria phosphatilytica TaxID=657387 RepID=A0A1S1NX99_9GAMM|nr:HlyU family transcriptional regulator [Kushneria phosphatilytica]OHV12098.1 hypothetical protein BH688_05430 [Kushneria phosphatilytica]QEL11294.1 hypothetical protein FY550_09180 [Kushneria phosphatilytica]
MLKRLLSGLMSGSRPAPDNGSESEAAESVEYRGYHIIPEPQKVSGQYRVSGRIQRVDADGQVQEQRFERSDTVPDRDGCIELIRLKAERYIDDHGERVFEQR